MNHSLSVGRKGPPRPHSWSELGRERDPGLEAPGWVSGPTSGEPRMGVRPDWVVPHLPRVGGQLPGLGSFVACGLWAAAWPGHLRLGPKFSHKPVWGHKVVRPRSQVPSP